MKNSVLVALILGLIGIIFVAGGASASLNVVTNTATCNACGMEVSKSDISTLKIVTTTGDEYYACCPVCAAEVAIYYNNCTIYGQCYVSGKSIAITVVNGNYSSVSVTPSDPTDNVAVVIGGGGCKTNKLVSNTNYANQVLQTYSSNPNASIKTLPQVFSMARTKLSQSTLSYKQVEIPAINYALIGIGASFLVASPLSWRLLKSHLPKKEVLKQ